MKLSIKAPGAALALALLAISLAAPAGSAGEVRVTERVLDNGLNVIVAEDHTSPLAVFQIWYRVGARYEEAGKTGTSHLLEHMMFKGTPSYGPTEFSRAIRRLGGTDNAFTSKEYTGYYQRLPSKDIRVSFQMESDRMGNLILDPGETLSERSVVMEERRLRYDDNPQNSLFESVVATAFLVHPYRWPVIGWMTDLGGISHEDLLRHYRKHYGPDNAFIVVAGDVESEEMFEMAREYFGHLKPVGKSPAAPREEPSQRGERRVELLREAELPYVIAAYHTPTLFSAEGYALDILSEVLTGKSGRLYRSMVYEQGLALSADAGYMGLYSEPFLFYLDATASPGAKIEAVERALFDEIAKIAAAPPTEFEMQKARNGLEASFVMGQDSIMNQAMLIGRFEIAGSWRNTQEYINRIREVTPGEVSAVAAKYLIKENRTVGVLVPLGAQVPLGPKDEGEAPGEGADAAAENN